MMPVAEPHVSINANGIWTCALSAGLVGALVLWPFTRRREQKGTENSQSAQGTSSAAVDLVEWGIKLGQLGKPELAAQRLARATKINPSDGSAYYNLGLALYEVKQHQLALEAYNKAVQLEPGFADARINLGCVLYATGEYELAVEQFQKAIELKPEDADAWFGLGCACLAVGNAARSVEAFERALSMNPDDAEARFNLACALHRQGDRQRAEEQFREFIKTATLGMEQQRAYAERALQAYDQQERDR